MDNKTIAIMQPTYLPWIGYFDLIDQSDCFVLLDSVQFDRRSWQQRNRIRNRECAQWLTVPVLTKGRRYQRICEVEIDQSRNFAEKHIATIQHCYNKAPYFSDYFGGFTSILLEKHTRLSSLNVELIRWLCKSIGIFTELCESSTAEVTGNRVELLVNLCQQVDANRYLSPVGSKGYIEENNLFEENDIALEYHSYEPPEYRQSSQEFIPYLSVLDLLFNVGTESLSVMQNGRT